MCRDWFTLWFHPRDINFFSPQNYKCTRFSLCEVRVFFLPKAKSQCRLGCILWLLYFIIASLTYLVNVYNECGSPSNVSMLLRELCSSIFFRLMLLGCQWKGITQSFSIICIFFFVQHFSSMLLRISVMILYVWLFFYPTCAIPCAHTVFFSQAEEIWHVEFSYPKIV